MFKNFVLKKLVESRLGSVPPETQEKLMKLIEEKPELLSKIAAEAQEKIKAGKDQMQAMMEVMQEHKDEIKGALE